MAQYQIEAYKGSEKYIFVSYAHKDSDQVFPIMKTLKSRGYRIWYDEGIVPGSEWTDNIAKRLNNSAMVIAFVTPNFTASVNCRREVNFALSKQKPILSVILMPTKMPLGMEMQLSSQQSVIRQQFTSEEKFIEKICDFPKMERCRLPLDAHKMMVEPANNAPTEQSQDVFDIRYHAEIAETVRQDQVRKQVARYGGIVSSATAAVGALILMAVTVMMFANYHQENLANYTSLPQFPAWLAEFLPGVWPALPEITGPDYWKLENIPAIVWLIAAGWFLRSVGATFKRNRVAEKLMGIAAVLRLAAFIGHIMLCAIVEEAIQQGAYRWEIWLPYYLPIENLVAIAVMIAVGYGIGRTVNWTVLKILSISLRVDLP